MNLQEAATLLAADIEQLTSAAEPLSVPALRGLAVRLGMVHSALLLPTTPRAGKLESNVDAATRVEVGKQFAKARGGSSGLTEAAHAAGYSLRALAEACGVSHSYLSQLASGGRPASPAIVRRVAELTGWNGWPRKKTTG